MTQSTRPSVNLSPSDTQRLCTAYKELLKLDSNSIRIDLQMALCELRDSIALQLKISSQHVQETFEQLALAEKLNA